MNPAFEVVTVGAACLIQDQGRPGLAHLGVTWSGAADVSSARLANRLVGNTADAAVLEALGGGLTLRALAPLRVAVTGAAGPIKHAGTDVPWGRALLLAPGDELRIGMPSHGLRTYVAVAGGVAAEPVLGSRSRDTLSGLGPEPLAVGDVLAVGAAIQVIEDRPGKPGSQQDAPLSSAPGAGTVEVPWTPGPRADWFAPDAFEALAAGEWTVSSQTDRIGIRIDGPQLPRVVTRELPSEPVVTGSVQVTSGGQPVVFGPDHPTTGGYPVIAVVQRAGVDALSQARPGQRVRWVRR